MDGSPSEPEKPKEDGKEQEDVKLPDIKQEDVKKPDIKEEKEEPGSDAARQPPQPAAAGGESTEEPKAKKAKVKEEGSAPRRSQPVKSDKPYSQQVELAFPRMKVKTIMKLAGEDIEKISAEAINVVCKASECFLEQFALDCWGTANENGRRMIRYQDLHQTRVSKPPLMFLEAIIPPPGPQ